jgi:hypothetical protein
MTIPPNVRVNAQLPFPSLVVGTGPITISKKNGIWQIGFTINGFSSINPPIGNYPTDFLLGYDSVGLTFFKISLTNLAAAVSNVGGARNQRSVTATPIVIAGTDQVLNCNIAAAAACALPAAATRNGVPLTFNDLGQATAHNITLTPNGAETIDGLNAPYVLKNNWQWVTLMPFNDGTNSGWKVQ